MRLSHSIVALAALMILSGCTSGGTPPSTPEASPTRTVSPEPTVDAEPEPVEEEPWIAFGGIYACQPVGGSRGGTTEFYIFYEDGFAMSATSTAGIAQIDIVAKWFHRDGDMTGLSVGEFEVNGDTLRGSTTVSAGASPSVTVTFAGHKGDDGSPVLDTTSQFNGNQETVVCQLARA